MGQNPVPPVNIPIPTKIDENGWCSYPTMVLLVLTHSHIRQVGHFWRVPARQDAARDGIKAVREAAAKMKRPGSEVGLGRSERRVFSEGDSELFFGWYRIWKAPGNGCLM